VIPNQSVDEIRSREGPSFPKDLAQGFYLNYPGFEARKQGLSNDWLLQDLDHIKLTQSLNIVTHDLIDETTASVHNILGEDSEWHAAPLTTSVSELVARLSSHVFLGLPLC
jgi:hypothetical protein